MSHQRQTLISYYVEPNPEDMTKHQYRIMRDGKTVDTVETEDEAARMVAELKQSQQRALQQRAARWRGLGLKSRSARRHVDARSTPVFVFNIFGLLNKFIATIATLCAAALHALGSDFVTYALDAVVICISIGLIHSAIWGILYAFGIEIETAEAMKVNQRKQ